MATPFRAATAFVPDSVSPPGLDASTTVTVPLKLVNVLPSASWATTCTAGLMATPATADVGCPVNVSCVAATVTRKSVADSALLPNATHALARAV